MKLLHVTCINGSSLHIFSRKFLPNNLVIILISSYARQSPYLVKGGFRSWVEEGFRVKELKTETTLVILSEVHNEFLTAPLLQKNFLSNFIGLYQLFSHYMGQCQGFKLLFAISGLKWSSTLLLLCSTENKGILGIQIFQIELNCWARAVSITSLFLLF